MTAHGVAGEGPQTCNHGQVGFDECRQFLHYVVAHMVVLR